MKVLILGAGGYLGNVLFSRCKLLAGYSVCGTYFKRPQEGMYSLDILDVMNTRKIIDLFDPGVVVWCLLNADKELEMSDIGLRHLLSHLKPTVRFIYISTGLSSKEGQNEETPPEPREASLYLANYVNGKILGEQLVRSTNNHVIIRPGQIYGFGASGELDERMQRVQNAIKKDGKMIRSANAYISTVHVDDLASCIVELFGSNFVGTLCVASSKTVSYYDFYRFLARQIGVEDEKIIPDYESKFSSGYFDTSKMQSVLLTKMRNIE